MRRAYAQVTILSLFGATLLDDGPFLVVAAVTAATALVIYGGRRLIVAANGAGRSTTARVERPSTTRCDHGAAHPSLEPPGPAGRSSESGFGLAARE